MSQPFEAPRRLCVQAGRKVCNPTIRLLSGGLAGCIGLALATAGCVVEPMPRPPTALAAAPAVPPRLLTKAPAPQCTYTDEEPADRLRQTASNAAATDAGSGDATAPLSQADAAAAAAESLQRRERERDCFRDAEQRVRAKLTALQASVRATLRPAEKHASAGR